MYTVGVVMSYIITKAVVETVCCHPNHKLARAARTFPVVCCRLLDYIARRTRNQSTAVFGPRVFAESVSFVRKLFAYSLLTDEFMNSCCRGLWWQFQDSFKKAAFDRIEKCEKEREIIIKYKECKEQVRRRKIRERKKRMKALDRDRN